MSQWLEALNIASEIMDAAKSLFRMSLFVVNHSAQTSKKLLHRAGSRQGCRWHHLRMLAVFVMFVNVGTNVMIHASENICPANLLSGTVKCRCRTFNCKELQQFQTGE